MYCDHTLNNRFGVSSRKERVHDGFLYSFRDSDIASSEEKNWIVSHPDYDPAELEELRRPFFRSHSSATWMRARKQSMWPMRGAGNRRSCSDSTNRY